MRLPLLIPHSLSEGGTIQCGTDSGRPRVLELKPAHPSPQARILQQVEIQVKLLSYIAMKTAVLLHLGLGAIARASQVTSRQASFQDQCSTFDPASAGVANATVTDHAFIPSGSSINLTGNDPACAQTSQVVPVNLCRVALQISTTNRSGVVAEVWLPENWNGRLVTTGNGGLGGCQSWTLSAQDDWDMTDLGDDRHRLRKYCVYSCQRVCQRGHKQRSQWHFGNPVLKQ